MKVIVGLETTAHGIYETAVFSIALLYNNSPGLNSKEYNTATMVCICFLMIWIFAWKFWEKVYDHLSVPQRFLFFLIA